MEFKRVKVGHYTAELWDGIEVTILAYEGPTRKVWHILLDGYHEETEWTLNDAKYAAQAINARHWVNHNRAKAVA